MEDRRSTLFRARPRASFFSSSVNPVSYDSGMGGAVPCTELASIEEMFGLNRNKKLINQVIYE